ncbi:Ser/Thr protein kinase RdoA (MazF antagonist) [Gracilibacillus alcaliphilus]|nr:Ser/Thr protein kinase RdoA (MazF antagonist) [Gracilibacillus alcaliphilus]
MEQKILELLNQIYPVDIIKVEAVTDEMFRCTSVQGNYFARITNYKTYEAQLEEVTYTNFLSQEGFGASPAVSSLNGKIVERVILDNQEILAVLYQSAPGIHLQRNQWDASVLKELGRHIGRLHHLSKKFEQIHPVQYINDWHHNEEYSFLRYIPQEEGVIRGIAQEVLSTIKEIPKNQSNYGLLHGDIWLENVLVDSESKMAMIDFQDCEKHFYIFDLAVPIYSALEYSFVGGGNIVE